MFKFKKNSYSEDMFADTRMSFGDHLEDLRSHLWRAIYGFFLIMLGVFVLDGIGLITSWRYPFTTWEFGIGRPMLDFITAPVEDQLIEFQDRKVQRMLENMDTDEKLKNANRPQWVKMSTPIGALAAFQKDAALDLPMPANGPPVSYLELIARAQNQVNTAADLLRQKKWEKLKSIAGAFQDTAQRFSGATNVPQEFQATLPDWASNLTKEADNLLESANAERFAKCKIALVQIQDGLGDKGLVTSYWRIEEPLVLAAELGLPIGTTQGRYTLSTLSIMEAFMAYFKVALMCGLVLGSPWIFFQLWSFIAAGLYPHEKRLVNVYLPFSLVLFLLGVLACQFFVIPKAVGALLWFNEWLKLEPELRFNEWLSFAILMPLVFGISFQLPLVMMFLERVGIMTVQGYLSYWKIAFLVIHVFAAFLMPSPDILSMELLAIPLLGLYGLGILLCRLNPKDTESEEETSESDQMVEV
jgi:Tat protein translocase TatC